MTGLLQKLGLVPFFAQQLTDATLLRERLGRVITVQRTKITVACDSGERGVELSGALRQKSAVDRPTVGDWVVLDESLSRVSVHSTTFCRPAEIRHTVTSHFPA